MRRGILVGLVVIMSCGCANSIPWAVGSGDDDDDVTPTPTAPPSAYRTSLTVESGRVSEDLVNFPLLVSLHNSELQSVNDGGHVLKPDGSDIFFATPGGQVLAHEIEEYEPTSGVLTAWVKVPQIFAGAETLFYVHYGSESGLVYSPADVWSDYVAVWHFVPGAESTFRDATGNGHDAIGFASVVEGVVGPGVQLSGNEALSVNSTDALNASPEQPWVVSIWTDPQGTPQQDQALVAKMNALVGSAGWALARSGGDQPSAFLGDGDFVLQAIPPADNFGAGFQHVVLTLEPGGGMGFSAVRIHLDGEELQVQTNVPPMFIEGSVANNDALVIGATSAPNAYATAVIDEVRIATVARSPAWIQACFDSQESGNNFVIDGPEETL